MSTPAATILLVLAALIGLSVATGEWSDDPPAASSRPAPVAVIARRVEALRDLRFRSLPRPVGVTPAQASREGIEAFDRDYPRARQRADERILERLGLVDADFSMRRYAETVFGEAVGGYYDPADGRLRVVTGAATGTRYLAEVTLAHELTHALEDQRFGLDILSGGNDRALAKAALYEGSATELMDRYGRRYFSPGDALAGAVASAVADFPDIPPFLEAQLAFPYVGGLKFARELSRRGGGGWQLVDLALQTRPPASTEQVLHPDAYFEAEQPVPVRLRLRRVLGDGWRRAARGTWGELQTRELLGSTDTAEGWGGDRYELWTRGDDSLLAIRWRWDSGRDEAEFAERLREIAADLPGEHAVARRAGAVTLVVSDGAALARRAAASG